MNLKKTVITICVIFSIISLSSCEKASENLNSIAGKNGVFAIMETEKGDIVLNLFYKQTPLTVTNFVGLAEGTLTTTNGKHFYDGLTFHRVIENFMIQGGDPEGTGRGGPGYMFDNEIVDGLEFNKPGVLAMANAGANTNGSQFFITHVATTWLNGDYTIFGQVVTGQDVVNAIEQGDKIVKITIVRQGSEAKDFSCNQSDFDALLKTNAKEKEIATNKLMAEKKAEILKIFPTAVSDNNGIYYVVNSEGKGSKTGSGKAVSVEYKGYLLDGTVFDTSKGRAPLDFTTNAGKMIPGFDIMVQDMQLNENRTIIIPPELGYGVNGYGPIPANSYICFDIELIKN